MSSDRLRAIYIGSLLVLATLFILFVQGAFAGMLEEDNTPVVEINRIDLHSSFLGNYSKISVTIVNSDKDSHYFSISKVQDETVTETYNVTVSSGKTFSYQTDVLPDKVPVSSNKTVDSTLQVIKLIVYMDGQAKPVEEASFIFRDGTGSSV